MLVDYTIREEDRPEIIHSLILSLLSTQKLNLVDRLIASLLYRKIQFGYYSTLQMYELLFRIELNGIEGLSDLNTYTDHLRNGKSEGLGRWLEIEGTPLVTIDYPSFLDGLNRKKYKPLMDSPILRDLFGRVLMGDIHQHYLNLMGNGYIPPENIEVPIPVRTPTPMVYVDGRLVLNKTLPYSFRDLGKKKLLAMFQD